MNTRSIASKALFSAIISLTAMTAQQAIADHDHSEKMSYNKDLIQQIMVGEHRSSKNITRNQYRHPDQTLEFFGLTPNMSVVEVWPGAGWYSEILAPALKEQGHYYAAGFSLVTERTPVWRKMYQIKFNEKLKQSPNIYEHTIVTDLAIPERPEIAPEGSADLVLTFRNVHNWMKEEYAQDVFDSMYKALKPGGILGVVEHRAKPGTSIQAMIESGYVTEEHVIKLAEKSGFKLDSKSEINANPADSTAHTKGVWTLPPTLRLEEKDQKKYLEIGESDRMTLKFIKHWPDAFGES